MIGHGLSSEKMERRTRQWFGIKTHTGVKVANHLVIAVVAPLVEKIRNIDGVDGGSGRATLASACGELGPCNTRIYTDSSPATFPLRPSTF